MPGLRSRQLLETQRPLDAEIVVVDNGSTDDTPPESQHGRAHAPFPCNCYLSQSQACRARTTVPFAPLGVTCSRLPMTIAD